MIIRCASALFMLLSFSVGAQTDIYTCMINGIATYSDTPCGVQAKKVNLAAGTTVEHEFKKAQIEKSHDGFIRNQAKRIQAKKADFPAGTTIRHEIQRPQSQEIHGRPTAIARIIWYLILVFFVFVAISLAILKTPKAKGILGEAVVNLLAKTMLDKNEYHLIKNVTLRTNDGTTQIDHIIVSRYGVFVIETKNMKGWIFGSPDQKSWTQKIYRHTSKFQNPLHQNYKHIKTLATLLGISEKTIVSVIAFVGESTFKTAMPENVTQGRGWVRFVKSKKHLMLSDAEVTRIIGEIEGGRLKRSLKTNRDHVAHVNNIVAQKQPTNPE